MRSLQVGLARKGLLPRMQMWLLKWRQEGGTVPGHQWVYYEAGCCMLNSLDFAIQKAEKG